jgi:hypothetical protein
MTTERLQSVKVSRCKHAPKRDPRWVATSSARH